MLTETWEREEQPDNGAAMNGVSVALEVGRDGFDRSDECEYCVEIDEDGADPVILHFDALGHNLAGPSVRTINIHGDCMRYCDSDGDLSGELSELSGCCPDESDPTECVECVPISKCTLVFDELGHLERVLDRCGNLAWGREEQPDVGAKNGVRVVGLQIVHDENSESDSCPGYCPPDEYIFYRIEMKWDCLGHLFSATRSESNRVFGLEDCCCKGTLVFQFQIVDPDWNPSIPGSESELGGCVCSSFEVEVNLTPQSPNLGTDITFPCAPRWVWLYSSNLPVGDPNYGPPVHAICTRGDGVDGCGDSFTVNQISAECGPGAASFHIRINGTFFGPAGTIEIITDNYCDCDEVFGDFGKIGEIGPDGTCCIGDVHLSFFMEE